MKTQSPNEDKYGRTKCATCPRKGHGLAVFVHPKDPLQRYVCEVCYYAFDVLYGLVEASDK